MKKETPLPGHSPISDREVNVDFVSVSKLLLEVLDRVTEQYRFEDTEGLSETIGEGIL